MRYFATISASASAAVKEEINRIKPILLPKKQSFQSKIPIIDDLNDKKVNTLVRLSDDFQKSLHSMIGFDYIKTNSQPVEGILVRNEYLNYWRKLTSSGKVMIEGPGGCGKSIMIRLFSYLWKQVLNRPVVLLYNLNRWANGYYPYSALPKESNQTLYEQKELAATFVRDIITLNPSFQFKGRSLTDWQGDWEQRRAYLSPAIFTELIESLPNDTLFALDGINVLYTPSTQYNHPSGEPIQSQDLFLFKAINDLVINSSKFSVIGVTSRTDPLNKCALPSHIKPNTLSEFSLYETGILLNHYSSNGLFASKVTDDYKKLQHFLSGGNCIELLKTCTYENLIFKPNL